jgi:hypothetical protein
VLHPDYAKNGWIYITYASTEGGGEGGNTHKSQTRKRKSRPNRITIQMRGNTTKGQHFGSQLYLTMKVICTSQQENVAQSLSIHKTSLVTTKIYPSMRMEEFLQTILCKTKESSYPKEVAHENDQTPRQLLCHGRRMIHKHPN